MKRKILAIVLCVALLAAVVVAAVGCNKNQDTNVGEFTYEIGSVDDLNGLYERLGSDYNKGVYNLNADLDLSGVSSWTPIGFNSENAFTGKFNGNNHTIRYSVTKEIPDKTDVKAISDDVYVGLFGCTSGANINNLNVVADISIPVESNRLYVGGLIGYSFGNTVIDNVTVSGSIKTDIADLRISTIDEYGGVSTEQYGYYMTEYIGGVAGYVIGDSDIKNVDSYVDIEAGKCRKASNDRVRLDEVVAGGIVGMFRTVDLSSDTSNTSVTKIANATFSGDLEAIAGTVNMGGIIGLGYRVTAENLKVGQDKALKANARDRLNAGGIAGMLDRSDIKRIGVYLHSGSLTIGSVNGNGSASSFNIGGAIGYLANGSSCEYAYATVAIDIARSTNNYVGGLVGMLHFSEVKKAETVGTITYDEDDIFTDGLLSYTSDGRHSKSNYFYIYSGGLLGKIYGSSKVSDVCTAVNAYQGLVGEAMQGVEVVAVEDLPPVQTAANLTAKEIRQALNNWVATSAYADYDSVYCEETGSDDEKADANKSGLHNIRVTYRVTRNYTIESSYYVQDSRATADGYANDIGVKDAGKLSSIITDGSVPTF